MRILAILVILSMSVFLLGCGDDDGDSTSSGGSGVVSSSQENGSYHGRHNGDRPTWYFQRNMSEYPSQFKAVIVGCGQFMVPNNGHRYEYSGYVIKQSDVSGRGLAIVAPSSCGSSNAHILY